MTETEIKSKIATETPRVRKATLANFLNIPEEFKAIKQWVVYRFDPRETEKGSGAFSSKLGKPPVSPSSGNPLSWTDPKNFLSFDQAVNALKTNKPGNLAGIGLVFTGEEPFSGVDVDGCIDQGGNLTDRAREIVDRLDSYTEVSPSGTGLRIIGRGKLPEGDNGGKHGDYEAYSAARFLTMTGVVFGEKKAIREFSSDLAWFRKTFATKPEEKPSSRDHQENRQSSGPHSDDDILKILGKARNAAKIQDLMNGGGDSEGDAALIWELAFYTKDPAQIDRLMRTTNRGRKKWDEKRGKETFLIYEIKRCLAKYKGGSYEPKSKAAAGSPQVEAGKPDEWLSPVSFDRPILPEIPRGSFPDWIEKMIDAGAEATETPRELGAGLALFALSTACQKTFSTRPEPGYFEQLSLYILSIMDSSNRKTAVQKPFLNPIYQRQDELTRGAAEKIRLAERKIKNGGSVLEGLRRELSGKGGKRTREAIEAEIAEIEDNMPSMPVIPTLLVNDITSERLPVLMTENGERMGLFADEGGIFETMAGRYSKGVPNLDIFLQSYPGSYVRIDRGSRPPITLQHPALSMCVFSQTEVLSGLGDKPGFRGRGLLGRFLYLIPPSNLGYRKLQTTPIPQPVIDGYSRKLSALLSKEPAKGEHGPHPHALTLSLGALREWREFSLGIEATMRPGGGLEAMTDYAGKVPGHAARIAGLLHCAEHADENPEEYQISHETMEKALGIMAALLEHAKYAYGLVGADVRLEDAKRVLAWIERSGEGTFTARDAHYAMKKHFKTTEPLNAALEILSERYYIWELELEKRPGRPSKAFLVNPMVTEKRK